MNKIEGWEYSSYLIGAMSKTKENDGGASFRENVQRELLGRGVFPINPAQLEKQKTGMTTMDAIEKINGWVSSGKRVLLKQTGRNIWKGKTIVAEDGNLIHICGDLDYVKLSDWITFVYPLGSKPLGTFFECGVSIDSNIPVYIITDIPKKDLGQSLILGVEAIDGIFFENLAQYLEFIDKTYSLKKGE